MKNFTPRFIILHADKGKPVQKPMGFLPDDESGAISTDCPAWFSPPERSVNALLNYARSLHLIRTETAGVAECNLN